MDMQALLQQARDANASDLILVAGKVPCVYIHGRMKPLGEQPLSSDSLERLLDAFMTEPQKTQLRQGGDTDFAYGDAQVGRCRINIHKQRNTSAAAIRFINNRIPTFEELHLPGRLIELAQLPRGLVLVTGSTGSGKSTTLAAMIEYMNAQFERHVITLEDPVEFVFTHNRCVIEQREIGEDSPSFAQALRHVVRQKPDVILVGEMRDHETIATALTASETGHLVLGTLHTNSAAQTIERIIDVFEPAHQPQIRVQLANTLRAVVCQTLLPRDDQPGMIPALEIMMMIPAIRRAIREGETHLIPGMIETGQKFGMCTLDMALAEAVTGGMVAVESARAKAADPEKFERLLLMNKRGRSAIPEKNAPILDVTFDDAMTQTEPQPASKPWH